MSDRLAVDIGGTFVDAIEYDTETGEVSLQKAPTTPDNLATGVLDSIEKLGTDVQRSDVFIHGTTLGLNALLEREGGNTGIITTKNFRDVYEIGRFDVAEEEMYNIHYEKPDLLVPRRQRVGVQGRLDTDGDVAEPLDEQEVLEAAEYLVEEQGVDAIAVCFLHAYRNPEHERAAAERISERYPDLTVSISSNITREYREYERTTTTVIDAYIKPIFESYVNELDAAISDEGFDGEFYLARSGGGAVSVQEAKSAPVETILSGPAGGLIGASRVADQTEREQVLAVDMGGTSLDACVIEDGEPAVAHQSSLEEQPLLIPVYDIRTIGAGGGSIAWLDGKLLKVGPQSAGADPGPICYGQGGTDPTVTDAAVVLGYIDPDEFLGGDMELDVAATRDGIASRLADPQDLSVTDASRGVIDVTIANTVSAIREITVEKGLDPRDFSMVAYGGAGPMFNPMLARELQIDEVVIPQAPAVFSAWGMLMSDVVYDFSLTNIEPLEELGVETIDERFDQLEGKAVDQLRDEGFDRERVSLNRSIEMRYLGQEHTVEVPVTGAESTDELYSRFANEHESRYGHTMDDLAEVVHFRVRAVGQNQKPATEQLDSGHSDPRPSDSREAYCFATKERREFPVYRRESLAADDEIPGPAIIQEATATTVFHSDQTARVDEFGHIIIRQDGGER